MYRKTGRNISVSRDDLINAVIDKLHIYDNASPQNRKKMTNPYRDVIYTNTKEGKMVQVPSDIHEDAIQDWEESKQNVEEQHNQSHNTVVYNNELDKLRHYESNRHNESSSRGALPRDYDLHRKVYIPEPDTHNVIGVDATNQEHESKDFQEPENVQRYMDNEEECLTCNTNYEHNPKTQHSPYIEDVDYTEDDIEDTNDYNVANDESIYKYLFYLVLFGLVFVLYRTRTNREEIFNL